MDKILRDIPLGKQITTRVQRWETERGEWQRKATLQLRQPPRKLHAYITISRELGSGGTEISQCLAKRLGWQHYDRRIIEAIASRTHVREEIVTRFDECVPNELNTYLYNLFARELLNNTLYLSHLTEVLMSIVHCGNAVILGRGANFILPVEAGVRVRVVAPLEIRRQRLMQARGYDQRRALQEIARRDAEQRDFLQHHFRCRLEEPCGYDLMINTGRIDLAAATDLVARVAEMQLAVSSTPDPSQVCTA